MRFLGRALFGKAIYLWLEGWKDGMRQVVAHNRKHVACLVTHSVKTMPTLSSCLFRSNQEVGDCRSILQPLDVIRHLVVCRDFFSMVEANQGHLDLIVYPRWILLKLFFSLILGFLSNCWKLWQCHDGIIGCWDYCASWLLSNPFWVRGGQLN